MARRALVITYIMTYLLALTGIVRSLIQFHEHHLLTMVIAFSMYLLLLFAEPLLIRQKRRLIFVYVITQTAIICAVALITPGVDYWAALFCPLVAQVMHRVPTRTGFLITGFFTVAMSIMMVIGLVLTVSVPLILTFAAVYFALASLIAMTREALAANEVLREQQLDLTAAHEQLQTYTMRAQELAILQERNRLARDLHDSVTQSLYSLTLLAVAGERMIKAGDLRQIAGNQSRLGEIAQQALQEMRLLIYELRPLELESDGLVGALEHRLETVERRAGVQARVFLEGDLSVAPEAEEELYRIAQEALNNALKHAGASQVVLAIRATQDRVILEVEDNGQGFLLTEIQDMGGMGLVSMQERADRVGGKLAIRSAPGEGTKITVSMPTKPDDDALASGGGAGDQEASHD